MTNNYFDVICIGAALVDMVAKVLRHPQEDDEVFVSELKLMSGGAAANTAAACSTIGLRTAFLGKIGKNDLFGKKILDDFNENGVYTDLIRYSTNRGTGSAYVALDSDGERRIYAHSGAANYLDERDIEDREIISSKIIFLSSLKNYSSFIEAAKIGRKYQIPVILNPGMLLIEQGLESLENLLSFIDFLILSRREFATLMELKLKNTPLSEYSSTAPRLLKYGIKFIIITLGQDGALIVTKNKSLNVPSIQIKNIIDTTGAGDSFSAGFIFGLLEFGYSKFHHIIKSIKIGHFVAAGCIQELGARNGIPCHTNVRIFSKKLNKKV